MMSSPRPRRRSWLALMVVAVAAISMAGCSVEETLPHPDCIEGGSALIVAQSVSTASQIPCLEPLPDGWSVSRVRVVQDHTEVVLDSDRAGEDAAVLRLDDACDVTGAVSTPSDQVDAARFDAIDRLEPSFRARRFYLFAGGCAWWQFDFDRGASATLAVAIGDTLTLVSRESVNDGLRETFIDEDL